MNQNEYIPAHHTQTIIIMHVCKSMTDFSCIWVFQNNSCHMMPTFGLTCDGLCQAVLVRIRQKCDL